MMEGLPMDLQGKGNQNAQGNRKNQDQHKNL